MAQLVDQIPYAQAATLPTAGLTALRSLEVAGLLVGKRVLITGATGGSDGSRFSWPTRAGPG